jgi:cytochrome P450
MSSTRLDEAFMEIAKGTHENPQPFYSELRASEPIFRTPMGFYFVTSYDLAIQVLRNDDVFRVRPPEEGGHDRKGYANALWLRTMLSLDGTEQRRLRSLVNRLFTPKEAKAARGRIGEIVDTELDSLAGRVEIDFATEFVTRIPTQVILELLGIGEQHHEIFNAMSDALVETLDPAVSDETLARSDAIVENVANQILEQIEERRSHPRDDLLTFLVQVASEDGDRLSSDELLAMVIILISGGSETTPGTATIILFHLLKRRDLLDRLRTDDGIARSAIEELIRFDMGVPNSMGRYATEDIQVGDQLIRKNERVFASTLAANHDPSVFDRPERIDLEREPNRHIAFGFGHHHCLGANIAREELRETLIGFLRRYPDVELASPDDVTFAPGIIKRGPKSLPLRLGVPALVSG